MKKRRKERDSTKKRRKGRDRKKKKRKEIEKKKKRSKNKENEEEMERERKKKRRKERETEGEKESTLAAINVTTSRCTSSLAQIANSKVLGLTSPRLTPMERCTLLSRKPTWKEKNLTPPLPEIEAAALATNQFRLMHQDQPFVLWVSHHPLIPTNQASTEDLKRLQQALQDVNFYIEHKDRDEPIAEFLI
jgi:hypothetical protein